MADMRKSDPILTTICKWGASKKAAIDQAYWFAGGWEGWAQVELTLAMVQDHGYQYNNSQKNDTEREAHVFASDGQRADIALANKGQNYIIELKCESIGQMKDLKKMVQKDVTKIEGGLHADYKPATVWAVGLSYSPTGYQALENSGLGLEAYQPPAGVVPPFTLWYRKWSF